jgi:hypothetical protein
LEIYGLILGCQECDRQKREWDREDYELIPARNRLGENLCDNVNHKKVGGAIKKEHGTRPKEKA